MAKARKTGAAGDRRIYRAVGVILLVGVLSIAGILYLDYRRADGFWKASPAESANAKP